MQARFEGDGAHKILLRCGLASLEQVFHIWYHLSSTETSEECLGFQGKPFRCLVSVDVGRTSCLSPPGLAESS
jgi:hypothetical protein